MKGLYILGLILAAGSSAAEIQRREADTGSHVTTPYRARIPDDVKMTAADRGRVAMQMFASCVIDRSGRRIATALAEPTEFAQNSGMAKLADGECLDAGEMEFRRLGLRGAVFTELYRRREAGRNGLPSMPGYDLARAAGATGQLQIYWWLMDFADCVVAKDRAASKGFVIAPVVNESETVAMKILTPSLGPCVTADQQIAFSRTVIKGALAEVLYRGAQSSSTTEGKN